MEIVIRQTDCVIIYYMKRELTYFKIGEAVGGNQDWFSDPMMRLGGCAAVCACDSCLYFTLFCGVKSVYPYDSANLNKADYEKFAMSMKSYLRPRLQGINKLPIYVDGFSKYLVEHDNRQIQMTCISGDQPESEARQAVSEQIMTGIPVPCLIISHRDPAYKDYVWHWFMLTGFDDNDNDFLVKATTFGESQWLSFSGLWNTRSKPCGGLIIYQGISLQ